MEFNPETSERPDWLDGSIPYSRRYGDVYFSRHDPLGEFRHVFLAGNGLPARFRPGFRIAELGFGTGFNLLASLAEWISAGTEGPLAYTGFEAHPMPVEDMRRVVDQYSELTSVAKLILESIADGRYRIRAPSLHAEIIIGDARLTVPKWQGYADAWFLDGFAPSRNPELWEDHLLIELAAHTAPGGTFSTYTAAGRVRRALQEAGFSVQRREGFGRKRHMLQGKLDQGHRSG